MGFKKTQALFKAGKITPAEYKRRLQAHQRAKKLKNMRTPKALVSKSNERLNDYQMTRCLAAAYVMSLLQPGKHMSRIPDMQDRPTFLYRSRTVYMISANFSGVADDGRFMAAVSPVLGSIAAPRSYKALITNVTSANWSTTNWQLASAWRSSDDEGNDPRVDENLYPLVGTQAGFNGWSSGGTVTSLRPLGTAPVVMPESTAPADFIVGDDGTNTTVVFPLGTYLVTFTGIGTFTSGNISFAGSNTVGTSLVHRDASGSMVTVTYLITVDEPGLIMAYAFSGASAFTSSTLLITPSWDALAPPILDCGILERLRVVGMQVLATYSGSDYNNGGNIACALLPGSDKGDNILSTRGNNLGLFQNWENLAKVNVQKYDGPLAKGACVRWVPDNTYNDLQLRTPSEANVYEYPFACIAGQWRPTQPLSGDAEFMRLEVETDFECVTSSNLFDSQSCIGSSSCVEDALRYIKTHNIPLATANDTHDEWAEKAEKGLKDFFGLVDTFFQEIGRILGIPADIVAGGAVASIMA